MMASYRQHGFDPEAYQEPGPPLRPYNWVQWMGFALAGVGLALTTLQIGAKLGWLPKWIEDPAPWSLILLLLGVGLINSRRQPATDVAPELAAARKRWLIILGTICGVLLGLAAILDLSGAN